MIARIRLVLARWASRLPAPVRAAIRRAVPRGEVKAVALDPWTRPLVGDSPAPIVWPAPADRMAVDTPTQAAEVVADLRCLLVTESLDASGMDEFVAFLARRLPSQGITAGVLLAADSPGWREGRLAAALRSEGVAVFSTDASGAATVFDEWRPDVVYSHGAVTWPLVQARERGIPSLETLHGLHNVFHRSEHELAERRALLAGVVTVSELVRRQYLSRDAGAPPESVVTIPNGVDRARLEMADRQTARAALGLTDEFLFVSLARHAIQKNTYGLADAFLDVAAQRPRAHLLICGRGEDVDYTQQVLAVRSRRDAAHQLHLRDNTDRVGTLLAAADCLVLDSFFEGWSLASMEALGAGVPVLLSDVGGAREQLEGGVPRGLLVRNPLGDPLAVDWPAMASARYTRQANREELVQGMLRFVDGRVPLGSREEIAQDARERFSDDLCLRRHAGVVKAAASRTSLARAIDSVGREERP